MARWPAARSLLFGLISVVLGGFPAATQARKDKFRLDDTVPPRVVKPFQLPQDAKARQRLEAAYDYIEDRSWPDAVRLLQALLDAPSDSFRRLPPRRKNETSQHWTSIRGEAEELLIGLPKEGMEFYRATYEGRARKLLDAARARHDVAALHEIVRRFRHTKAGGEALEQLGSYYLDRGQTEFADACFQQLLRVPGPDPLAPRTLFKTVLAARAAAATPLDAIAAWRKLVESLGEGGLSLGQETYQADKLRELLERWPVASTDDYLLYRGNAARSGRGRGDAFVAEPQFRLATAQGEARQWIVQAKKATGQLVLPAATPLALDGKIIYRGADGLHAVDAQTGQPLWRRASLLSLASILNNAGQKMVMKEWLRLYGADRAVLVENTALGMLSSDGQRVYALEDLPLPPHPNLPPSESDEPHWFGPLRHFVGYNTLRALEATTGKLSWEIGGPRVAEGRSAPPLRGVYFLGPPLPLGKQLFAVVEAQQEVKLVCLDAENGGVRWTQMLATATDPLLNVVRHTQAVHLAYGEGVVVCPTHSGAIVGVDPLSRSLRWASTYGPTSARPMAGIEGEVEIAAPPLRSGWKGAAPIVCGGRVVFAPPDSEEIHCLHLRDGSPAWKAARGADDLYVGCVYKRGVLLIGRQSCRMLGLDSGEVLWQRPTGGPTGHGIAAGSLYYLPLRGVILALHLDRPQESRRIASPALRGDLGNLLFHQGILLSQSADEIVALTSWTTQLAHFDKRLAHSPRDSSLLLQRGRLRLEHGDWIGAVADLRAALTHDPAPALRTTIRDSLFAALTQLLQGDFTAGEKYLDEYRVLCRPPIPATAEPRQRIALEKEGYRRLTQYLVLLALGCEKQGRTVEAFEAYRELSRRFDELMTVPNEPALRTRPDLWVRGRVAALFAHASPTQRQLLNQRIRQEGQSLSHSFDRAALQSYLALFGGIEGEEASTIAEVRLHLARHLARASGRRHALEAELLLHDARGDGDEKHGFLHAQALHEHALLLTRQALLDEAVAAYRRLAQDHGETIVHEGRTGAQLLADLQTDKRFLPYVETPFDSRKTSKPQPVSSFRVPCVPCLLLPGNEIPAIVRAPLLNPVRELPAWCGRCRFAVDGLKVRLQDTDRASGAERYSIPLLLPSVPAYLRDGEIPFQAVDHLLVLSVGSMLIGVDVLERRVCWKRNVGDAPAAKGKPEDWFGPVGPSAVCIHTRGALTALDPASGEARWTRGEVGRDTSVFGDDKYIFLIEHADDGSYRALHAVRAYDGVSVSIPDALARAKLRSKR